MKIQPRYRRRRFPVIPATRSVEWVLRAADQGKAFPFIRVNSLAQLNIRAMRADIPTDTWVLLERDGQLIYRGPWGGDLPNAPTLL